MFGLFQKRIAGDDSLLRLAGLRFAQAGLGAEVYAETGAELDWLLGLVPGEQLPMVHLSRSLDLLRADHRQLVVQFAVRFAGRVRGLVVHDRIEMAVRRDDLAAAATDIELELAQVSGSPELFVEYAAGTDLEMFVEMVERLEGLDHISACVDIGHVGIKQTRDAFSRKHPGTDVCSIQPWSPMLLKVVDDVQEAVASALPAALDLITALGHLRKPVHLHMHDGHPLKPGLSDHMSFLTRIPIPFEYEGRRSLEPLFGPAGLGAIIARAWTACGPGRLSLTLEIHEAEGRLPLADAAPLFAHWRDATNAERMDQWLSTLAQNQQVALAFLQWCSSDRLTS